ncbi:MAG: hypothetical protein COB69_03200 [Phycisphaera sp.]|nr:MAG: hypothetical protein COB69_03200 [Phycisphaera sp.]
MDPRFEEDNNVPVITMSRDGIELGNNRPRNTKMRKQTELAAAALASLTLLLTGCGSGDDENAAADVITDQVEKAETAVAEQVEEPASDALSGLTEIVEDVKDVDLGDLGLSLNDGKKWLMDDHTRTSIASLKGIVDGASIDSLESATALGGELKGAMTELIQGCTMEGPSHNMLHGFLGKFMPKLDSLTEAVNLEAAQGTFTEIKSMLAGYSNIFE